MQPHYSIDTSALIDWWVRYYPPSTFPTLQARLEELIQSGRLRASREVQTELERNDDDLCKWAKSRDLFIDSDAAIQKIAIRIINQYRNDAKPDKGINGADPFVIALAASQTKSWVIVTGEKPGTLENPKIPFVCTRENPKIETISFLQLIAREGWKF